MFFQAKQLNARQAQQKNSDANSDYFAVRFAIRSNDKQTAAMLETYASRYSTWISNIEALQEMLAERQ